MTKFKANILPKQTSTLGEVRCDPVQIFTKLYSYLKKKIKPSKEYNSHKAF